MQFQSQPSLLEQIHRTSTKSGIVSLLFEFMKEKGQETYEEEVTQYQHAVQTAFLASDEGAPDALIVAALLHDIGHMVANEKNGMEGFYSKDMFHEQVAADFLKDLFPANVIDPIRLHVPAKRYMCTREHDYYDALSGASKRSFQLQGGFMTGAEQVEFEKEPYYVDAVQLRIWDDNAKVRHRQVPEIEVYAEVVERMLVG